MVDSDNNRLILIKPVPSIKIFCYDEIEIIKFNNISKLLSQNFEIKSFLRKSLTKLLQLIPIDVDDLWDWVLNASQLIIARVFGKKEIISLSTVDVFDIKSMNKRLIYFHLSIVKQEFRGRGILLKMNKMHLAEFIILKRNNSYFATRTFSPRVFGTIMRRGGAYPNINNSKIPDNILEIAKLLISDYYMINFDDFNEKKLILYNIYSKTDCFFDANGNFLVSQDKNPKINQYFSNNLNYKCGDTQMIVGKVRFLNVIFVAYSKITVRIHKNKTIDLDRVFLFDGNKN